MARVPDYIFRVEEDIITITGNNVRRETAPGPSNVTVALLVRLPKRELDLLIEDLKENYERIAPDNWRKST